MRPDIKTLFIAFLLTLYASAQEPDKGEAEQPNLWSASTFAGLKLRSIGPAVTSGRIVDFAVDPRNRKRYFAAAASGGVWLTENAGTTWKPVFDSQGSYSIGDVEMDPSNPLVIWVGTGENNSQRSVSYGDGVYRSSDGGRSWQNMGLKDSQHIGRILIDPRDSNIVYVAAQGPLWNAGGDRGLYKTVDGGKTWSKVLETSQHTGVNDVVMDPRDSSTLYASTYQRRRRVWTMINGGPESAVYKSIDAGETWTQLKRGLPGGDLGRIGLAISPADPDVIYALVEATEDKGGIFRSRDRGAHWEKRNGFNSTAFYYGEIIADPIDPDRIYIPNTFTMVSDDGGATVQRLPEANKHVDSHAMWIDPDDPEYYLSGCDGGIYESFDRGRTWSFQANLPITQFYDVGLDDDLPFYHVYGGTQDNFTLGGPSRTPTANGIVNSDWFVVRGGDGFKVRVDPRDPNTVYAEAQYGALVRFNRANGERIGIQPYDRPDGEPLRWNWDAPLIISPHSPTRLYFAANYLFKSEDRGDSWTQISGELSRAIDPNTLEVMGRIWPPEAVAKGSGTSEYGNATALAESPLVEGLLYAGSDDGVLSISEDGGDTWRRVESFEGIPEMSYVSRLVASAHVAQRVYATFDNHKSGDFKPYLIKSEDRGRTWTSLASSLPENGPVLALAEDSENPNLIFAGTEFGLFFSSDGGEKWIQLKGGLPTIAVRDLAVQARESDLVAATFGRGFYILDDFSPLREVSPEDLDQEALLFSVRDPLSFVESRPLGGNGKAFQGAAFYTAPNPAPAIFTYFLKDALKGLKQKRKDAEKKEESAGYPSLEDFRAEQEEIPPRIALTIHNQEGRVVRRLKGSTAKGIHRVQWDLRYASSRLNQTGPRVPPGRYTVTLAKIEQGNTTQLAPAQDFNVLLLPGNPPGSFQEQDAFRLRLDKLVSSLQGARQTAQDLEKQLQTIDQALDAAPGPVDALSQASRLLGDELKAIQIKLRGDPVIQRHGSRQTLPLLRRAGRLSSDLRGTSSEPTPSHEQQLLLLERELMPLLERLRTLVKESLPELQRQLDDAGVPWTTGRLPRWP